MLRARLSPLCCIRQQWDWAVCFISAHIKASTHQKCLGELFSKGLIEKVFFFFLFFFLFGTWVSYVCSGFSFAALILKDTTEQIAFHAWRALLLFFSSPHQWDTSSGSYYINIQGVTGSKGVWMMNALFSLSTCFSPIFFHPFWQWIALTILSSKSKCLIPKGA